MPVGPTNFKLLRKSCSRNSCYALSCRQFTEFSMMLSIKKIALLKKSHLFGRWLFLGLSTHRENWRVVQGILIIVDKSCFADDVLAFRCFRHVDELFYGTSSLAVGVHKEWAVNRIGAVFDSFNV